MSLTTIILAAGKSTRMNSLQSKLLFKISGKPIIEHVVNTAREIKSKEIICVLNKSSNELMVRQTNSIRQTNYSNRQANSIDRIKRIKDSSNEF